MRVTVELPDEVAEQIQKSGGDVGRRILEAFAVEGYRRGSLTGWQVQKLLGIGNRFELDKFFNQAGVTRDYSPEELERDYQASQRASDRFAVRP